MITVEKKDFLSAIRIIRSVVMKVPTIPILSTIHLECAKGGIILSSYNTVDFVKAMVLANVEEEIDVCINAEKLEGIINSLDEVFTIRKEGAFIFFESGKTKFKTIFTDGKDFPSVDITFDGENITLNADIFSKAINKTVFASQQGVQSVLGGVCFNFNEGQCEVFATDGNRLSTFSFNQDTNIKGEYILPRNALLNLIRNIKSDVSMYFNDKTLTLKTDDFIYVTQLLSGQYPPCKQLFPTTFKKEVIIDKTCLLKSLEKVAIMCNQKTNTTTCVFDKGALKILTQCDDGAATDVLDINYIYDEPFTIVFNYKYLIEGLRNFDTEEITIKMNENLSAAILSGDYNYLIMPMQMR